MDKYDSKIGFGTYADNTIRELYKLDPNRFIATSKTNPVEPHKKNVVFLMRDYLRFLGGEVGIEQEAEPTLDFSDSSTTSKSSQASVPGRVQNNCSENRYIKQIWSYKTSNKDKTVFKTLAIDSNLKSKKFNNCTVAPLETLSDTSRFHIVLITKSPNGTVIRKAGLDAKLLNYLNTSYQTCVTMELNGKLGLDVPKGKSASILHQPYMYMAGTEGGKRNYETTINYTCGNSYPFYICIDNTLEDSKGKKTPLGKDYINLSIDEFGSMLKAISDFERNFRENKYNIAFACAKAGGYLDESIYD